MQGWNLLKLDASNHLAPAEFTAFVEQQGPSLQPDVVIYCICLNDVPSRITDVFMADNSRNKARFKLFPESLREFFKRKAVYRLARDSYREARFHQLDFSSLPTPPPTAEFWDRVRAELKNLKQAVEKLNARLYCLIVPFSYQVLPANGDLYSINQQWQACLDDNHIPWVDLTSLFNPENVLRYFALGDYIHLNDQGHALIAQQAEKLITRPSDYERDPPGKNDSARIP